MFSLLCELSLGQLLTALAAAVQVYSNTSGNTSCLNVTQEGPEDLGLNGWDYQSCTEMVMPMCSNGVTDVFYDDPVSCVVQTLFVYV